MPIIAVMVSLPSPTKMVSKPPTNCVVVFATPVNATGTAPFPFKFPLSTPAL
jgi:hypothetical protein